MLHSYGVLYLVRTEKCGHMISTGRNIRLQNFLLVYKTAKFDKHVLLLFVAK